MLVSTKEIKKYHHKIVRDEYISTNKTRHRESQISHSENGNPGKQADDTDDDTSEYLKDAFVKLPITTRIDAK